MERRGLGGSIMGQSNRKQCKECIEQRRSPFEEEKGQNKLASIAEVIKRQLKDRQVVKPQ